MVTTSLHPTVTHPAVFSDFREPDPEHESSHQHGHHEHELSHGFHDNEIGEEIFNREKAKKAQLRAVSIAAALEAHDDDGEEEKEPDRITWFT